jgi:putative inorganic carbon (HCO3(-)) transporter
LAIATVRTRIFSIFWGSGDSSNAFRLNVWLSVLKMIQSRPLLGIGPGNRAFNLVYPLYQRSNFSALGTYSVPLEITVETGIVGLVVYGWLLGTVLVQAWHKLLALRLDRDGEGLWIIGSLSALAGLMAQGLFDTVWFRPPVQILWWLCIAILCPIEQAEPR